MNPSYSTCSQIGLFLLSVFSMVLSDIEFSNVYGQTKNVYELSKRSVVQEESQRVARSLSKSQWDPQKTAVIVCDVWDYHHSINAVRRLEEMLPSMDKLLRVARQSGSIVIHSPSDCMPSYMDHPARLRAERITKSDLPPRIASWICRASKEEMGVYPLDQSDGGEDDQPEEHKLWAEKLRSLGRNPNLPWKSQNAALSIDAEKDYISDRGDEVWAILRSNQIEHVIMIGVHTNMCVLGRPFGLRQLVNNEVDVVLVRDLTDCMYNPKQWPYVDHYTGNDLLIEYVERYVCPTITSDQIIGGQQVSFSKDTRAKRDLMSTEIERIGQKPPKWELVSWKSLSTKLPANQSTKMLLRCSLRIPPSEFLSKPSEFLSKPSESPVRVVLSHPRIKNAWLNGHRLELSTSSSSLSHFQIEASQTFGNDDTSVLVIELDSGAASQNPQVTGSDSAPIVMSETGSIALSGDWQARSVWTQDDTNLPLPAKFALPPAVYYTLPDR